MQAGIGRGPGGRFCVACYGGISVPTIPHYGPLSTIWLSYFGATMPYLLLPTMSYLPLSTVTIHYGHYPPLDTGYVPRFSSALENGRTDVPAPGRPFPP